MGTPEFAVEPLARLLTSSHTVVAVVTQPDKPVGRGRTVAFPPVKYLALNNKIPVLQPEKLRGTSFDKELALYDADCIVVAAYGKILPKEVLDLPRFGCLNIHASLLPKYRGAAPIQWAIINGDRKTGVSIMVMEEGLDTGPVISTSELEIIPEDDASLVANALSVLGADLLVKELDKIERAGTIVSTPQVDSQSTYAPMLKKSDGLIDWKNGTVDEIICRIMGLRPWPIAFSCLKGELWKFLRAEPYNVMGFGNIDAQLAKEAPEGTVVALIKGRGFCVKVKNGYLLITECQPQGKRVLKGVDVLNGKLISLGDLFVSDATLL